MKTNKEGLTFPQWCDAAKVDPSKADSASVSLWVKAWQDCEDPAEWAALKERKDYE